MRNFKPSLQCDLRLKYFKFFYKKKKFLGGRSAITGRVINRTLRNFRGKKNYHVLANTCAPRFTALTLRKAFLFLGKKYYNYKHKSSSLIRFKFGIIAHVPSSLAQYLYMIRSPLWYSKIVSSWLHKTKQYDTLRLGDMAPATRIRFVVKNFSKNIIAHAVGSYATLVIILQTIHSAVILAPSGKLLLIHPATIAAVFDFNDKRWIDANRVMLLHAQNRRGVRKMLLRNRRSVVRGTVKNPCDHPHGGRTRGILRPRTPWNKSVLKSKIYVGKPITLRDIL